MNAAKPLLQIMLSLAFIYARGAAAEPAAAPPPDPPPFYLGGIQVNEADHAAWFAALQQQRMNTVAVTAYARQGDWDSDNLFWDADAPWVTREIRGARARGLHVVFVARVALDHAFPKNARLWHGMIQPRSDALLEAYFERYTRFVLGWARRCQEAGVEVFAIGSEMNALASTLPAEGLPALEAYYLDRLKEQERLEAGEDAARVAAHKAWAAQVTEGGSLAAVNRRRRLLDRHWRRLIAEVRQVYRGKLTYAANFDQYRQVGFWDALDFLGVNAYFKLRGEIPPAGDRDGLYRLLLAGWRGVLGEMNDFRRARRLEKMPAIFTEIGYTRRALSTLEPWSDAEPALVELPPARPGGKPARRWIVWREQPDDLEERALAVRALYAAHRELPAPFLRGLLYWKLSSHDYHLPIESFMVHVGPGSRDPILPELRRFLP
jgi:hypothetical protein